MAPSIKLTYFDSHARAEPIRYLLALGGIEYQDERIAVEDWPSVKPRTPFGQLPILEVNGKVTNQFISICRYLAKQLGLAGKDDWESQEIDALADTIEDLNKAINEYGWDCLPSEKPAKKEKLVKETIPMMFSRFEKLISENNGYFVNGKLSYADIVLAGLSEFFSVVIGFDITDGYPNVKALVDKVHSIPKIKEWINKRPPAPFAFKMTE